MGLIYRTVTILTTYKVVKNIYVTVINSVLRLIFELLKILRIYSCLLVVASYLFTIMLLYIIIII